MSLRRHGGAALDRCWLGFTLDRRSFFCRPSRYGLVLLVMLAALLVGSINHNNNLGFLLTFLLGSMMLVSLQHTLRNLRGVSAGGQAPPPVHAGQQLDCALWLRAAPPARIGLSATLDHHHHSSTDIRGNSPTIVRLPCTTSRRGLLQLDSLQLSSSYPLGLVELRTRVPLQLSCLVYPRPLATPLVTNATTRAPGWDGQLIETSSGSEVSGLSNYTPGDNLRHVAWKTLARGQGLHTRTFAEQHSPTLVFALEQLPGMDRETRISRLCHLVLAAAAGGMRYGILLPDQEIAPARGRAHRDRCLKALALQP